MKLHSHTNAEAVMWVIRVLLSFSIFHFFAKESRARLRNASDKALKRLDTLKEGLDSPLH